MNTAPGKMFFTILAAFAEFEAGLLRLRTARRAAPGYGEAPRHPE